MSTGFLKLLLRSSTGPVIVTSLLSVVFHLVLNQVPGLLQIFQKNLLNNFSRCCTLMFFISPLACLSWEFFWLPFFSTRMPSSIWKRNMGIFWRRKKISPWLQFLTTLSEIQLQYILHQWSDGTAERSIIINMARFVVFSYDYDDGINGTVLCWLAA